VNGGRYGLMAYPLVATITMDSKADTLTVMAVRIVIGLCMGTPSSISSGGDMKKGYGRGELSCVK
jgi:hypothetical protein